MRKKQLILFLVSPLTYKRYTKQVQPSCAVTGIKLMRAVSCWALTALRCRLLLFPGNRLPAGPLSWHALYLWSWVECGHHILTFSPWACPGSQKVTVAVRFCRQVLSPPYRSSVWHYPRKKKNKRNKNKDLRSMTEECVWIWNVQVEGKKNPIKQNENSYEQISHQKKKKGKSLNGLPQLVTKIVSSLNNFWDLLQFSGFNRRKEEQK